MYNANNYGYNPYGRYIPQQPIEQPIQQVQPMINTQVQQPLNNAYKLQAKLVDSLETAKSSEYNLDGSTSYFILTDNSCIITKQLQNDGTTKMTIYKPVVEDNSEQPRYATIDDLNKSINEIDLSDIDDLKDELKELRKEIKELKKKKKDD